MSVKFPERVEDWTVRDRASLLYLIDDIAEAIDMTYDSVYVVGSYCYNVCSPGDLDLVIFAPDEKANNGKGLIDHIKKYLYEHIENRIDVKIYYEWYLPRTSDLGLEIPYYNVEHGHFVHKVPYSVIPFTFRYDTSEDRFITYLRDKKTPVMKKLLS